MFARLRQLCSSILVATVLITSPIAKAGDDGIIKVKSAYPMRETIERLKTDIAGNGIKFFDEIDRQILPPMPGSSCGRRPCWSSAILHSVRNS